MIIALFLITSNGVCSALVPSRFSKSFTASITAVKWVCYGTSAHIRLFSAIHWFSAIHGMV